MKIREILGRGVPTISFEVFPPKTAENYDSVKEAALEIAGLQPSFMSVTYGAGGGTSKYTVDIAAALKEQGGVTPLAHLTCVSSTREKVHQVLGELRERGIENVLALRGDIPADGHVEQDYHYASELIREIRSEGDFCVGAACYPEGHVESANKADDIQHLKEKVEAGCDFVTTQMFFDNNILYHFLYQVREQGITVPVVAGIMPVTSKSQIRRIGLMSGAQLPVRFRAMVERFGDDPAAMKQAGIAYATEQIIDLIANGVNAIHVYTMNKPEVAAKLRENLSDIIR
ncbi:MAG TPA: methylenetetrahydrofolate reductase [NAD(P)H] [Candidatus Lachnoclostridium stercorigallinarum]|uniref:Methylenetetrahydrofolate reductase n=1 Tax=Candidatus Lachnoclostridium stercorigallinarum TaxID=2838634 RepID=A0A9D2GFU5_9FIRM|nr:methylenetetrahydrofolate reductase [NAD(P)H] [Candidatus Lachnoclostridium stercorigallinarum]